MSTEQMKARAQEGKYLTFALDQEEYGIEILRVREIIGLREITAIPQMPDYAKGVINLRGKVIPILDIRRKFGLNAIEVTSETCIIVINIQQNLMGIIVDRVCEVIDIVQDAIEPPPAFGSGVRTDFILGMGKTGERVKMLLDIEKVLMEDLAIIRQSMTQAEAE